MKSQEELFTALVRVWDIARRAALDAKTRDEDRCALADIMAEAGLALDDVTYRLSSTAAAPRDATKDPQKGDVVRAVWAHPNLHSGTSPVLIVLHRLGDLVAISSSDGLAGTITWCRVEAWCATDAWISTWEVVK